MDIAKLKTEPSLEQGAWVDIDEESSIKVAYTGSRDYKRRIGKRFKPFTNLVAAGGVSAIPDSEQEALAMTSLVQDVLLDWKGIKEDGADVPYTKENASRLLQVESFRVMVERAAADVSNFRAQEQERDAKNSATASAGA